MSDETTTTESAPTNPRLERLRAEIAELAERKKANAAAISDEEREEIELRRKRAEALEEVEQQELEQREVDLERRFEEAKAAFPDAQMTTLEIQGYPDTFILKHDRGAYARWETEMAASVSNKRLKRADINRRWAVSLVIDWNGQDLSEPTAPAGKLVAYLKENAGIVSAITNAGAELAGAFGKARKS